MKKTFILLGVAFSLFIYGCTNNTPVSPEEGQQGGITLNIDRVHKPDNVVSVTAYLTREGFDTLSGTLSLLSDTTADITFNDIAAGGWHLKVDASDEQNVVVYTGEKDVNILAGITTPVYLTLMPTGAGTGNIYIYVNWGVPPNTNWVDYPNNPILSSTIIPNSPLAVIRPKVYLENGVYKMWFSSLYNAAVADIWYAVSNDGINWQLGNSSPVLTRGEPGSWDDYSVMSGPVYKDNNGYKMYFLGFHNENEMWHIGLAISSDGITWTKYSNPIIYANPQEFHLLPEDIKIINNTFYLYYATKVYPYYDIRLATSQDGITFTKSPDNPILTAVENWEGTGVKSPSIIYDDGIYKMIYTNFPETSIGIAYSNDGINWTRELDNPFFSLEDVHNGWCNNITYPFWRKYNNQYRIYYTGNTSSYFAASTGLIYK